MLRDLLKTMRPKQWTKNALVFIGFIFTLNQKWTLFSPTMWDWLARTLVAFVLLCAVSSAVYILNDVLDIDKDRAHPVKRNRPLPAGRITPHQAIAAMLVLLGVALPVSFLLAPLFGLVVVGYYVLMVAYSLWLKHMVLIDIFTIAGGFVLRAVAGAVVIDVAISPWLFVCTLLGALFIGFGKRRHELLLLNNGASNHRQILAEYTPDLLEQIITIVISSTVMAYSLYTFSAENLPKNHAMMLTIPFALYGAFRYLYLIHLRNEGGSPEEMLLKDRPILVDIALWGLSVMAILYFFR
ncbi:MAG: decaprenyl-phosphate phosphoribosyltransferase [Chloroflexota bacterium]|nr:decaprenyl-phosphate phosphoribosyltransferase [Chloroflexota bacterium]